MWTSTRRALPVALAPLLVYAALSLAASCPPKHPDPQARAAQVASEVLIRLGELQDTAIAANQQGALSDADAVRIVRFTVGSAKTIRQTPYGWGPSVLTAYQELKPFLLTLPKVAPFVQVFDLLFGGL